MTDNPPDPATTIVLVHGFWMTRHASSLPPPDRQRQRAIYRERRARGALAPKLWHIQAAFLRAALRPTA